MHSQEYVILTVMHITGGIPLLLAALNKDRASAQLASLMLAELIPTEHCETYGKTVLLRLVQLQAVTHLSTTLSPVLAEDDTEDIKSQGKGACCPTALSRLYFLP